MRAARTTISSVFRALLTIAAAIVLGLCPQHVVWAQGNPQQRYREIVRSFRSDSRAATPFFEAERVWTLKLGSTPSAAGVMDADRIYLPLRDSMLVALERESGLLAWLRPLEVITTPAVGNGLLYVVSGAALKALDAATGDERWSVPLDMPVTTPLVWDSGWVLALVEPGEVRAFRASDGALIWRQPLGASSTHPLVAGGTNALYVALTNGRLVALALETGAVLWERTLPGTLSQPAVGKDRVFVGSTDNFLYALDPESGAEAWKWRNGGDVIGAAVDGDVVYFVSLDNIIRAVNRGNGNQRWRKPTGTRPVQPPQAFQGVVVVAGLMPAVTAFVAETGEVMGSHPVEGALVGAPLVDSAPKAFQVALVTVTREGVVEALRPTGLMFREGKLTPVEHLPGRPLGRERVD